MRPRLQLERGQTLMAILFQQSGRYQIAVNLDAWSHFDGIRWTQIESEKEHKQILRQQYLCSMQDKLSKVNHWNDFKPEEAMSSKSYRWSRQLPTPNTPCLPKQTMVIGFQTLIGVLPVKCNKIHNKRNDDTACVMCGHHKETIEHYVNAKTKRYEP